jgi:mannose-6-phosphate isomerase-like protein (cupin superfamily)
LGLEIIQVDKFRLFQTAILSKKIMTCSRIQPLSRITAIRLGKLRDLSVHLSSIFGLGFVRIVDPGGSFASLEEEEGDYKIKRIEVKPGHRLSLQMHQQ